MRREAFELDCCRCRASQLPDNSFDLVFSNSLVEHLGDFKSQKLFADEVRRLAPRYFVQTPDRLCPVEPHFVTPFIHWLPRDVQRRLIRNFTFWGLRARPSQSYCDHLSEEIALLSKREMRRLFPDATVLSERFAVVPKSLIAVKAGTSVPPLSLVKQSVRQSKSTISAHKNRFLSEPLPTALWSGYRQVRQADGGENPAQCPAQSSGLVNRTSERCGSGLLDCLIE
jgi:methyltransferase family protein